MRICVLILVAAPLVPTLAPFPIQIPFSLLVSKDLKSTWAAGAVPDFFLLHLFLE